MKIFKKISIFFQHFRFPYYSSSLIAIIMFSKNNHSFYYSEQKFHNFFSLVPFWKKLMINSLWAKQKKIINFFNGKNQNFFYFISKKNFLNDRISLSHQKYFISKKNFFCLKWFFMAVLLKPNQNQKIRLIIKLAKWKKNQFFFKK